MNTRSIKIRTPDEIWSSTPMRITDQAQRLLARDDDTRRGLLGAGAQGRIGHVDPGFDGQHAPTAAPGDGS